jgi:copper(I)-binding protein
MAMLHQSTRTGTMEGMQDVDSVPLPAGSLVTLAPGATHIMLMDLKHPLKPGDTLTLELHFARAGTEAVNVPVRPIGASGP